MRRDLPSFEVIIDLALERSGMSTRYKLAKELGISPQSLYQKRLGKKKMLHLLALAGLLEVK